MRGCLADAEAAPHDVDLILSTSANTDIDDSLVAVAVRSVFGDSAPPVASIVNKIGHAMGAAAMLDVALAVEMVRRGRAPASLHPAGVPDGGIETILCIGIGLNGVFGAVLIRTAAR